MANHFSALKTGVNLLTPALMALMLVACAEPDTPEIVPATPERSEPLTTEPPPAQLDLSEWAELTVQQCPAQLEAFSVATESLSAAIAEVPQADTHDLLEAAQSEWRNTLRAWTAAHWCIADALPGSTRADHQNRLALVSAAPALAGFIDAVPGYEDSGIVHDENVPLTPEGLLSQHQITDDGEVAVGLYALEVLLFGIVHRNRADFGNPEAETEHHTTRRSKMLLLLSEHLTAQAEDWQAYWAAHTPESTETQAALLTHQAHTTFTQLAALGAQIDLSRPGLALNGEHDALVAAAWLESVLPWWQDEATEALVVSADLELAEWQSTGTELAGFEQDNPDWAMLSWQSEQAASHLDQLLDQLPDVGLPGF